MLPGCLCLKPKPSSATLKSESQAMSLASHLNLRLLQLLAAIGETGNLTQAAARLCIVPSAASRRIRAAEAALGVTLIERSSRGVALTPAGEAVARHATQMQRGLARLS